MAAKRFLSMVSVRQQVIIEVAVIFSSCKGMHLSEKVVE